MAETEKPQLKLDVKRIILVGLAFFTISMFWQIYDNLMPLFLLDFNINRTLTGIIMALDNILALVLLPFMGIWSDKFPMKLRNKFGRRMPFIVCGSLLAASFFLLTNYAHNSRNLALMLVSTAFVLMFMCLYRTPAVALMPDVTPKPIRSQGNTIINIMGAVGTVIVLILGAIPGVIKTKLMEVDGEMVKFIDGNNWLIVGIIAALMVIAAVIMVFKVKENKMLEQKKEQLKAIGLDEDDLEDETQTGEKITTKKAIAGLSKSQIKSLAFILLSVFLWYMAYNGVTTHFSYFALRVLDIDKFTLPLLVANVAAFIMFVPSSILGKKFGRKKTVLLGVLMLIAGFVVASLLLLPFVPLSITKIAMYPAFVLVGGGWATINVHSYVMSVEMATEKTTGAFTGLYYSFAMGAQIVTPIIAGALIDYVSARLLMPYALLFSILAFISMLFVKHGNAKDIDGKSEGNHPESVLKTEDSNTENLSKSEDVAGKDTAQ